MKYLNKYQIAEMLACTPSAAVRLMKEWKVPFYYLGPGRGLGYRWKLEDVEAKMNTRKVNVEATKRKNRKKELEKCNKRLDELLTKLKT